MPDISITVNQAQIDSLLSQLNGNAANTRKAVVSAVNKTTNTGRTRISRAVAAQMSAKKGGVDKRIKTAKATASSPEARIRLLGGAGVGLINFYVRQGASGVSAKVFGQKQAIAHAFIATGINSNKHVFLREGPKRKMMKGNYAGQMKQPLKSLYGPRVPVVFEDTPGLADKELADIREVLAKNLKSQVNRFIK